MTVAEFNLMGRAKKVINQDVSVVSINFDAAGRLTSRSTTPANGTTATTETFAYDGLDRVTSQATTSTNPAETLPTSTSYKYSEANQAPNVEKTITITPTSGPQIQSTIETDYLQSGRPAQTVLPSGRTLAYDYNDAGKLEEIATAGTAAEIKYIGGRRKELTTGPVTTTFDYDPPASGLRVSATNHSSSGTPLDSRTNTWDENYNRVGRDIDSAPNAPAAWAKAHTYVYDGLDRMEQSTTDGASQKDYDLDEAGNRRQTTDGDYTLSGTGKFLHQYSGAPEGAMAYDGAGRLSERLGPGRSYKYDAMGRLKELIVGASVDVEDFSGFDPDQFDLTGEWDIESDWNNDYLRETSPNSGGRLLLPPVSNLRTFTFRYQTEQDPATPNIFDPEYYAQVVLRAAQLPNNEWKFLALVIQPDGIYLREWNADVVTELGGVAVPIPQDQWHTVTIELSGELNGEGHEVVVVKHLLADTTETQSIQAETSVLGEGSIGFGVGEKAEFKFDDLLTDTPTVAPVALRYHYDAQGRVVGRTLAPGTQDEETQYFIYDNDRIVQELLIDQGNTVLVAEWVYGSYIDEILAMYRVAARPTITCKTISTTSSRLRIATAIPSNATPTTTMARRRCG